MLTSLALATGSAAALAQAVPGCGSLENGYGPYDYRSDRDKLTIVENFHFPPEVETLIRGKSGYLGGDLDYTLRAFPNHHRALVSMMRYGERLKVPRVPAANFDVECYFKRAVAFRPNDAIARMLYATYLMDQKRRDEAIYQLDLARLDAADVGFTHYNVGLMYLELGQFDRAREEAQTALSLGFPRPDLKQRLIAAGKWAEPASAPH